MIVARPGRGEKRKNAASAFDKEQSKWKRGGGCLARGEEKESGIGRPRLGAKNWSTKRSQREKER